ncbi:SusE domain-containing protein [Flavobacterium limnophilum]|uniref:SusE domain-containing protein n=1 Tax=Flavobacterium limnophilum TaxID=3003262 RepID=UPI0024826BB1|nr:SusE domain-containing protein [Flavobacterium limnophilum]
MKKLIYSILFICNVLLFSSCTDDKPIFIADLGSEEIAFTNSFASEYLLSKETKNNIADRFIWNPSILGVNSDYEVQAAIDEAFTKPVSIGVSKQTNIPVLVSQLLDLADQLGLDEDPKTTDSAGKPNNTGVVYFRVKSKIGNGGAGTEEIISTIQMINIKLIEKVPTSTACNPLWVVGDAIKNVGWNFTLPTKCESDVQRVKISFLNGKFRFFTAENNWATGLNYEYYKNKGYVIDARLKSEGAGDFNFEFIGTPGIYEMVVDSVKKTIVLNPSGSLWAVGDATPGDWNFSGGETELVETSPDIWEATAAYKVGDFRFFQSKGVWDTNNNFKHYKDLGYTIDAKLTNGGGNDENFHFNGPAGTYKLVINAIDKTIKMTN